MSDIFSLLCKTVGAEYSCWSTMHVNFSLNSFFICAYADRNCGGKKFDWSFFFFKCISLWFYLLLAYLLKLYDCALFAAHSCRNNHLLWFFWKQRSNRHRWWSQWSDRVHYPVQPQRPSELIICLLLNSGSIKTSLLQLRSNQISGWNKPTAAKVWLYKGFVYPSLLHKWKLTFRQSESRIFKIEI